MGKIGKVELRLYLRMLQAPVVLQGESAKAGKVP